MDISRLMKLVFDLKPQLTSPWKFLPLWATIFVMVPAVRALKGNQLLSKCWSIKRLQTKCWECVRSKRQLTKRSEFQLLFAAAGLFSFYVTYGIAQDKLLTKDEHGNRFDYTLSLLFLQCIGNSMVASFFWWVITSNV